MRSTLFSLALFLAGCVVAPAPAPYEPAPPPPVAEAVPEAPPPSVYEEPPAYQPAPVVVAWAPPPMLVEVPPPMPFESAVWVGGYWVWRGNWVWASGRWMGPPQPTYVWVHPYYEHRADAVIFIDGHWAPPGVMFVPPPRTLPIVYARPAYGVMPGPRPIGPEGCFVPPPPGSRQRHHRAGAHRHRAGGRDQCAAGDCSGHAGHRERRQRQQRPRQQPCHQHHERHQCHEPDHRRSGGCHGQRPCVHRLGSLGTAPGRCPTCRGAGARAGAGVQPSGRARCGAGQRLRRARAPAGNPP